MKVKLHMALGCSKFNRVIYLRTDGRIKIGCRHYTREEAVAAIQEKYKGNKADAYIAKVDEAFEGCEYDLDALVNDTNWEVRYAVAQQGVGLDVLVNDTHWRVRREVAQQGYALDVLVNDPSGDVRHAVAQQGFGLDVLVNDTHWTIRHAVARQGYALDQLVNDFDRDVRNAAKIKLEELQQ